MARIFIIGSNGQLGSECVKAFGAEAFGSDFPDIDITDEASARKALDAVEAGGVVVNCAAYTAVDKAESERDACERLNAAAPGILGRLCRERDLFLIHISTDYVFSGEREIPRAWLESDAPAPQGWYGETKLRGEIAVAESGCRHAILRTAWLYGINGKNFLKTMLRLAAANSTAGEPLKPIRVVSDQFGCPTCAADLAKQIKEIAKSKEFPSGVYHAVSSGWTNWFEFAKDFLVLTGVEHKIQAIKTVEYPTPAKRPANSILDTARLRGLGIYTMPDWKDALAEFVELNKERLST